MAPASARPSAIWRAATTSKIEGAATAPSAIRPPSQMASATAAANRSTGIHLIIIDGSWPMSAGCRGAIDAFARARDEAKPVLLSIVTPWSEACAEMDRTTYADPGIAAAIADDFVPVRVDADRRPDIAERYGLDVWPTTAFLTADGAMITGGLFMPADRMLAALAQVRDAFVARRDELLDSREHWRAAEPAPPHPDSSAPLSDAELETLVFESFDEEHGGFGGAPKFPLTAPLALALELLRGVAGRTPRADRADVARRHGLGPALRRKRRRVLPLRRRAGLERAAAREAARDQRGAAAPLPRCRRHPSRRPLPRTRRRDAAIRPDVARRSGRRRLDRVAARPRPAPVGASAGAPVRGDVFYAGWNAAMVGCRAPRLARRSTTRASASSR